MEVPPPWLSPLCSPPAAAHAGDAAEDPEADEGLPLAPSSSSSSGRAPRGSEMFTSRSIPAKLRDSVPTTPLTLSCCGIALWTWAPRGTGCPARGSPKPCPGHPCTPWAGCSFVPSASVPPLSPQPRVSPRSSPPPCSPPCGSCPCHLGLPAQCKRR